MTDALQVRDDFYGKDNGLEPTCALVQARTIPIFRSHTVNDLSSTVRFGLTYAHGRERRSNQT